MASFYQWSNNLSLIYTENAEYPYFAKYGSNSHFSYGKQLRVRYKLHFVYLSKSPRKNKGQESSSTFLQKEFASHCKRKQAGVCSSVYLRYVCLTIVSITRIKEQISVQLPWTFQDITYINSWQIDSLFHPSRAVPLLPSWNAGPS
jgi:RNA recognition motif-containing protein